LRVRHCSVSLLQVGLRPCSEAPCGRPELFVERGDALLQCLLCRGAHVGLCVRARRRNCIQLAATCAGHLAVHTLPVPTKQQVSTPRPGRATRTAWRTLPCGTWPQMRGHRHSLRRMLRHCSPGGGRRCPLEVGIWNAHASTSSSPASQMHRHRSGALPQALLVLTVKIQGHQSLQRVLGERQSGWVARSPKTHRFRASPEVRRCTQQRETE